MSNMSYCRFQNTASDLRDCMSVLEGEEYEYYGNVCKLSEEEQEAMECIFEMAHRLVEIDENRDCESFFDEDYEDPDEEDEE